jgi:hypothetical protein
MKKVLFDGLQSAASAAELLFECSVHKSKPKVDSFETSGSRLRQAHRDPDAGAKMTLL